MASHLYIVCHVQVSIQRPLPPKILIRLGLYSLQNVCGQQRRCQLLICIDQHTLHAQPLTFKLHFLPKINPHSKNKKHFRAPFLVLQLAMNRGLVSVPGRTTSGIFFHLDPNIPIVGLPGADWSFWVLSRVPYL